MRPLHVHHLKSLARSSIGKVVGSLTGTKTRFVIFSSGRAGSNVLVSLLKQHPNIHVHSEIFGEYQLEDHGIRRKVNSVGPVAYLESYWQPMMAETAIGLKMLYYQLDERYGKVRGIPGVEAVREAMASDDDLLFLHLQRENLFALLVSLKLAEMSSNWVGKTYEIDSVEIDPEWAERTLQKFIDDAAAYAAWVPKERCLHLTYEQLADNTDAVMTTIFEFLRMESVPVSLDMKRQTEKPHRAYVSNYDELKAHFAGHEFAKYM